jgi:DNA-binding transcriptional LysR family regulator
MTVPSDLKGIVTFVHVVEAGSFTRAAERLHVTKSAVGKAVAHIEAQLGVRLFNRTTRSLSLTGEGQTYYEACRRALAEIDTAQAALAAHRQVPSGRLRVDLPMAFGRRCVAPILFDIAARYPDLAFEISFNDRRVDPIEEGIDLVVRLGELEDTPSLAARRIYIQRAAICASPAYLDRAGRPKTVDDIAAHAAVVYGRDGRHSPWQMIDTKGRRSFTPTARLVLGHGEPLLDAALAGCGLAFLPTWLAGEHLRRGELETVLSDRCVETGPAYAVWPVTRSLAPKIRVVVDALLAAFARPHWDEGLA